jgi:hypothetical protein
VEIQMDSFPELTKRFVLYSAKLLTGQIKKGDEYGDIEPVVSIIVSGRNPRIAAATVGKMTKKVNDVASCGLTGTYSGRRCTRLL